MATTAGTCVRSNYWYLKAAPTAGNCVLPQLLVPTVSAAIIAGVGM